MTACFGDMEKGQGNGKETTRRDCPEEVMLRGVRRPDGWQRVVQAEGTAGAGGWGSDPCIGREMMHIE